MTRIFKWVAPLLVGAIMFTSCSEEDKKADLKHSTGYNMMSSIENLAVIGSIDILKLIEKSGFESNPDLPMEASAGYKMMVKEKLDAEKTGIDLSGNNHFAVSMIDPENPEYVVFTAKVTNPENAKLTVQDILKGSYASEEVDGDTYEFVTEDDIVVAWDAEDLVIVFSEQVDPKSVAKDLMKARYIDGPDEDNGMEAYLEQEDDMNVYVRVENSVAFLEKQDAEIPSELLEGLDGAYYVGTGNFNNGEIVFEWNINAEEIKNSAFNALAAEAIHDSFLNYLSNDKLIAFGTASINMGAIFNALELAQNNEFSFEDFEEETGLSKDMMEEMFTGQFALSFVDVKSEQVTMDLGSSEVEGDDFFEETYSYDKEVPVVIFTAGVSDTTKLGELLRASGEAQVSNGIYQMDKDAFITFHSDKLILTTDQETAQYFGSGQMYNSFAVPSSADMSKPLFGYVNTNPALIPEGLMKMAQNEEGKIALEVMEMFESVQFTGEFEHMVFKAVMMNKTENALKVITDYILKQVKEKQMI